MITDCFGSGINPLDEFAFFVDTLALHVFGIPAIIGYILWRFFVSNKVGPRGGITVLGLDDSSSIYSELGQYRLRHYIRFAYVLVSVLTFVLGVIAFELRF